MSDPVLFLEQQKLDALVRAGANIDELVYAVEQDLRNSEAERATLGEQHQPIPPGLDTAIATCKFKLSYLQSLKNQSLSSP